MELVILLLIISYLLGSIPTSLWLGKVFHGLDIRKHGSGNMGTTNAFRVLGKKSGILCLLYDVFKGAIVISTINIFNLDTKEIHIMYFGFAAIIGHVFSIFANFKGGKAVATSTGMTLALTPIPTLISMGIFTILLLIFGFVSLSSTAAAISITTLIFITGNYAIEIKLLYIGLSLFIFYKHRGNYIRLINGTEQGLKNKKKQ